MTQELFTVNLSAEPDAELREKLRRYLHIRYSGPRQKAFDPQVEGVAYMHNKTVLKLFRPSGSKPWRVTCLTTDPSLERQPSTYLVPRTQKGQSLPLHRLKPGTELKTGQGASFSAQLEQQVRDVLGPNATS